MKEQQTRNWRHRPDLDEPELVHTCKIGNKEVSYPQFCGFEDEKGQEHLISRVMALSLGLIGLKEVPDWRMTWEEWGKIKNKK